MPTKKPDHPKPPRMFSLASAIAWLSLLLLATAFGRTLDQRWQDIWARAGAFGLAAAVGLGSLEKARLVREKYVRGLASRVSFERSEGRVTQLNEQSAALARIEDAIHRLSKHIATAPRTQAENPSSGGNALALRHFPLQVIPVDTDVEAFDLATAHAIAGSLHSITSRVVTFEHDQAFSERVAVLKFTLAKHEKICFVVDIKWTHIPDGRFVTSGAVMAVGVPADQPSGIAPVELDHERVPA